MYRQSKKSLLNISISPTCPHNMVNYGQLVADIGLPVWDIPVNFNGFRVLASLLHRCRSTDVNQTLHDVWPSPWLVRYVCVSGGACLLTEFCKMQNSLCVQVLRSPILTALMHGTGAAGVNQTLWRGTRNGITELLQRVPPILDRAAITFGIGPHSSFFMLVA